MIHLLDMASAANQAAPVIHVGAADLDHDTARRSRADQLVRIMAGGALHLVSGEKSVINALARQAAAVPGRRHGSVIDGQRRLGVADVVGHWILQAAISRGQRRVVRERERMDDMQVRSDLEGRINVIGHVCAQAADGGVDAERTIVTAQAGQRDTVGGGPHRGIQRRAAVHREGSRRGLVVPQRNDLRRISVVRRMAGRTHTVSSVPGVVGAGKVVRRAFNTLIDCRPR